MNTNLTEEQYDLLSRKLKVKVLTFDQLQALSAPRLLAYLRKHRNALNYLFVHMEFNDVDLSKLAGTYLEKIRTILATKPHIEKT